MVPGEVTAGGQEICRFAEPLLVPASSRRLQRA